jgi:uncharacterized protein (TIGR03118 family)
MLVQAQLARSVRFLAIAILAVAVLSAAAFAQYQVTNLVSNVAGGGKTIDPDLVNAWGIAFSPTGPFWVSDNGTGLSTLYTGKGVKQSLVVTVPSASGVGMGTPTGMVFNSTTDFVVTQNGKSGAAAFIFDTLDGTISGWSPSVNPTVAVIAVNTPGSVYTGLAIGVSNGSNFIYAADSANNKVDIYDGNFKFVSSFTDPNLPAGSEPYGIQNINNQLFVTFTNTKGTGAVDIFDLSGNLVKTFTKGGTLRTPWGLALAPSNFGPASSAILVGNLGDGRINAFNATTGKLIGQLKTTTGTTLSINGLWGLAFGAGNMMNGQKNQLFFSAGPAGYSQGLFGVIVFK